MIKTYKQQLVEQQKDNERQRRLLQKHARDHGLAPRDGIPCFGTLQGKRCSKLSCGTRACNQDDLCPYCAPWSGCDLDHIVALRRLGPSRRMTGITWASYNWNPWREKLARHAAKKQGLVIVIRPAGKSWYGNRTTEIMVYLPE